MGLKQIRQNTCNSLWFKEDEVYRGDKGNRHLSALNMHSLRTQSVDDLNVGGRNKGLGHLLGRQTPHNVPRAAEGTARCLPEGPRTK